MDKQPSNTAEPTSEDEWELVKRYEYESYKRFIDGRDKERLVRQKEYKENLLKQVTKCSNLPPFFCQTCLQFSPTQY